MSHVQDYDLIVVTDRIENQEGIAHERHDANAQFVRLVTSERSLFQQRSYSVHAIDNGRGRRRISLIELGKDFVGFAKGRFGEANLH